VANEFLARQAKAYRTSSLGFLSKLWQNEVMGVTFEHSRVCLLVIGSFFAMTIASQTTNVQRVSNGTWGGQGIHLEVNEKSAKVEFDCAHGTINGPMTLDSKGEFKLKGTFTRERGGPVRSDQNESGAAATYSGSIKGETMTLDLKIEGQDQPLASYILTQGKAGRLHKCL
jgi:hypothetical protein